MINTEWHFPCPIYTVERPDFLQSVSQVSEESLAESRKTEQVNDIHPVLMSGNYFADPRIAPFSQFIADTAWNILQDQGYAMQNFRTSFIEMWTQEHYKVSGMEQHVHGFGSQIVGFYFLEAPEGSSRVVFHDPRPGKIPLNLPEQNVSQATVASQMINFEPKPGLMIFSNAWLPHSFTRHTADKPIKFVHFNLTVQAAPPLPPPAEVV
jgi:hypothetical protein